MAPSQLHSGVSLLHISYSASSRRRKRDERHDMKGRAVEAENGVDNALIAGANVHAFYQINVAIRCAVAALLGLGVSPRLFPSELNDGGAGACFIPRDKYYPRDSTATGAANVAAKD
jgi:hypothetical protein